VKGKAYRRKGFIFVIKFIEDQTVYLWRRKLKEKVGEGSLIQTSLAEWEEKMRGAKPLGRRVL